MYECLILVDSYQFLDKLTITSPSGNSIFVRLKFEKISNELNQLFTEIKHSNIKQFKKNLSKELMLELKNLSI